MELRGLLRILSELKVDFIIVGCVAASIPASSWMTSDLDVVYDRSP